MNVTVWATTSCLLRFCPSSVSHRRCCNRPSMIAPLPLLRYCPQCSACLPNTTISTKQTSSFKSSPCLNRRLTANPKLATGVPFGVYRSSGFRVRFPIKITLLNPATVGLLCRGLYRPPLHQRLLMMDREKLDDVVFQSIGPLQLTDRIVRRFKVEIGVGALALAPDLIRQFLLSQVFGFDELRAGLVGNALHLVDEQ